MHHLCYHRAFRKPINFFFFSNSCFFVLVCRGQAEKEFRVEVEAIGHVRHKNLVRLLGYCVEGVHRYY